MLAALIAVHAGQTLWVATTDRTPPYLAIIDHQARVDTMLRELTADRPQHGRDDDRPLHPERVEVPTARYLPDFLEPLAIVLRACHYRPPLPMVAALPGMAVWPQSRSAGGAAGVVWIAILLASAYGIGRRLGDPVTGLVAATVLGAFPGVLGHRAVVLPFLPSAACVAACAHAVLALRAGERYAAARVGMWAGLAMLCRWDAAVPIGGVLAWYIATTPRGSRATAIVAAWPAIPAFVVAGGWWYAWGVWLFVPLYLGQGILTTQHAHEGIALLSVTNATYYPIRLVDTLAGVLAIPCAFAFVWILRRRHPALAVLAAWVGAGWAFYLIVPMKGARYALPLLCPLAVTAAIAARAAGRRWTAVLVVLALLQHLALVHAFPVERAWNRARTDPRMWGERPPLWEASIDAGRIRPWTDPAWSDVLDAMARAMGAPFARPTSILLADEGPSEYLASLESLPRLALHIASELPEAAIEDRVRAADFVVLSTVARPRSYGREDAGDRPVRVRAVAVDDAQRRELVFEGTLPDGTRVHLYGARR